MGITREQLADNLSSLGLERGDSVYVHTSMKRIGFIDGGPAALLEAFKDVLGAQGTLAAPTHSLSFPPFGKPPYDPATSPGVTGAFPETVRAHPLAMRSGHPSHSSAAVGARAEFLTANHCLNNPFAFDSPLHRLYRTGGKILLLGVGHTASTSLHMAEFLAGLPYVKLPYDASWGEPCMLDETGKAIFVPQVQYPGCSGHFYAMEGLFQYNGLLRYGLVGQAVCQLMDMRAVVDFTINILKEKPDFLLCREPGCPACGRRRELLDTL